MNKHLIGDKNKFAVEYAFSDDSHETELSMYVEGINILAFNVDGQCLTTQWNLDDLAFWLRKFIDGLQEDPYPVECEGEYAAQKDDNARDFDSDDEAEFEQYYQNLYEWNSRHRWHSASSGAILADVYFQLVDNNVEISWDNRDVESKVEFESVRGGARIPKEYFLSVIDSFLKVYADYWF